MEANKKRGNNTLKIIGIILLILFAVGVIFFIKGKIHDHRLALILFVEVLVDVSASFFIK
ncbi:MAG: hypothetical protein IJL55_05655 [Lachnospiraceae bacterium]|nr:hypothetical protein [Lachnospiraceae bacterium]